MHSSKKNSFAEFYIQFCCCDKQIQCPYNYVFAFLTTKIPILCQIFRRQQRYLMPLILTIFMTEFMRGVKLSSVFAKKYYRSYLLQWNLIFSLLFLTLNLLCFWLSWSNLAWVSPPQSNLCQTLQILIAKKQSQRSLCSKYCLYS